MLLRKKRDVQQRLSRSKARTVKRSAYIQYVIQRHQVQPFLYQLKKGSHFHGEIDDVIVKEDHHHRRNPTHVNCRRDFDEARNDIPRS